VCISTTSREVLQQWVQAVVIAITVAIAISIAMSVTNKPATVKVQQQHKSVVLRWLKYGSI